MTELDKMARALLAAEYERDRVTHVADCIRREAALTRLEYRSVRAIRTALLTAPPGGKLVPVEPTDEMVDAASDAHMPFGDMRFAITSAILAAPEVK